jgi:hypothetical protein
VTELLDNEPHFAPGHSDNGTGKVFGADGRFVTFTSNWGRNVGDVFVAKIKGAGT